MEAINGRIDVWARNHRAEAIVCRGRTCILLGVSDARSFDPGMQAMRRIISEFANNLVRMWAGLLTQTCSKLLVLIGRTYFLLNNRSVNNATLKVMPHPIKESVGLLAASFSHDRTVPTRPSAAALRTFFGTSPRPARCLTCQPAVACGARRWRGRAGRAWLLQPKGGMRMGGRHAAATQGF